MYHYKKKFIGHKAYCAGTNTKRTPAFDDYEDILKKKVQKKKSNTFFQVISNLIF